MPKEYFKVENTTSVNSLRKGAKIHVIGVCGVAMAQLAILLAKQGFQVSGSDKEYYEPMAGLLHNSPVKTFTGYKQENIPESADLIVIGNSASYGNPEVDAIEQKNLPYTLFPKILDETVIGDRHSIVVSGTHGKSTTSAMIASMIFKLKLDPSYFVGGASLDLPESLHAGSGNFCVLEGDEYDSAFFAKVPKFSFYHPHTCIVNAVEFDHADIYPNLDAINKEFTKLITTMPASGTAICCVDYENCRKLVAEWRQSAVCGIITFGEHPESDVLITSRIQKGFSQKVSAQSLTYGNFEFELPIPGAYNAKNALAALITAKIVGLEMPHAVAAISSFQSVKRRLEIKYQDNNRVLIEDFAHHPTAVSETIKAVKEAYPGKKLWAIFEPRSNTSRRKVFQEEYVKAFKNADQVVLAEVEARSSDAGQDLIEVKTLSKNIESAGVSSCCFPDVIAIENFITSNLAEDQAIVVMSNGSFGGLIQRLASVLKTK